MAPFLPLTLLSKTGVGRQAEGHTHPALATPSSFSEQLALLTALPEEPGFLLCCQAWEGGLCPWQNRNAHQLWGQLPLLPLPGPAVPALP